jgi:hypothetical protein
MTTVVAVIFGVFAIGLIVLLIYKSTLSMHRDDQLFLDDASSHMHAEQTELLSKVSHLILPVRVFGHGFRGNLSGSCGDAGLPKAERSAIASGVMIWQRFDCKKASQ